MTTKNQPHTLSRQILKARLAANLTQEQVASALNLSVSDVAELESGNSLVSTLELSKLAQLFRQPIASFVIDQDFAEQCNGIEDSASLLQQKLDRLATLESHAIGDEERSAVLQMALVAYTAEEISADKLRDVGAILGISVETLSKLAHSNE